MFLSVLPFFSRDFSDSVVTKDPLFFGGFSLPCQKECKEREELQTHSMCMHVVPYAFRKGVLGRMIMPVGSS